MEFVDGIDLREACYERCRDMHPELLLYAMQEFDDNYVEMHPAKWVQRRFFDSMKGFHRGNLDLSGRHEARYITLRTKWDGMMEDFKELERLAVSSPGTSTSDTDEPGRHEPSVHLLRELANRWTDFHAKWSLPPYEDFDYFSKEVSRVRKVLALHPKPKLQELLLAHLPGELLNRIFFFCHDQRARLLASVNRFLREIGMSFVFRTRVFSLNLNLQDLTPRPGVDRLVHFRKIAEKSLGDFIASANILLKHAAYLPDVESMTFCDTWSIYEHLDMSDEATRAPPVQQVWGDLDFYDQFNKAMRFFLTNACNMTSLLLLGIKITGDLIRIVNHYIPTLHTLLFQACDVPPEIQVQVTRGELPTSPSVLNLSLNLNCRVAEDECTMWYLLPLYPRAVNLSVHGMSENDYGFVSEPIRNRCNYFQTLTCFHIDSLYIDDVPLLTEQLQAAHQAMPRNSSLPLTHFRLMTSFSTRDEDMLALIDALEPAKQLTALVLNGIDTGHPSLIDHIAQRLPNLVALTLLRRASHRQQISKLSDWPYPSWEYAKRLAALKRLKHFGWNQLHPARDVSPSIMYDFEEGFEEEDGLCDRNVVAEDFQADAISLREQKMRLVGPFAAYCPSLWTFAIVAKSCLLSFGIWRDPGNYMLPHIHSISKKDVERWNPKVLDEGWPFVYPKQRIRRRLKRTDPIITF